MKIYDIISKKRDNKELTAREIDFFIEGYTKGIIPDYQIAALLMAIFLNGMSKRETLNLTRSMIYSGEMMDLSDIDGIKVDKHSTGGVGDTTTLVLGPMVAACDVPFVKMSGRGLGHTGGTLDKLESIENFQVELSMEKLIRNTNEINISLCSQTTNIAPADKKLYALRDVTATVDNISLIASSIMSKKLAIGSDAIILDVKVGNGAFMKNLNSALKLAKEMVDIGTGYGRETVAFITDMDQPLGNAIGNALEIKEAIQILKGQGPEDLYRLCLKLGSKLLLLAKRVQSQDEALSLLKDTIDSNKAYEKFLELIEYQGGNISHIENPELLPVAKYIVCVKSDRKGVVGSLNAEQVGKVALNLGAGRATMNSNIDPAVGVVLNKKIGDEVDKDDVLAYIHSNNMEKAMIAKADMERIYIIEDTYMKSDKLIHALITKEGTQLY